MGEELTGNKLSLGVEDDEEEDGGKREKKKTDKVEKFRREENG